MSIDYYYDIKAEGGTIKTEKPITFIFYILRFYINLRGEDAKHPPDSIPIKMCVSGARNIDTDKYDPCVDIYLKKLSGETISGEDSKYVNYEFYNGNGFEWKRKFIVPRKESISFDGQDVEYIDVIPNQQSDVSIIYPILIVLTTIFSLMMDAVSKLLEIKQEELKSENSKGGEQ